MTYAQDFEKAGKGCADLVADVLVAAGFEDVYTFPPSSWLCPEPIVCSCGDYSRESAQLAAERGVRVVDVVVCREDYVEAQAVAKAAEKAVRLADWTDAAEGYLERVAGIDTDAPWCTGQDKSLRWLWRFRAKLTVVREA